MQCVILAGGMGTRMLPLTSNSPKSLISINGNPFIFYQLKWLEKYNITKVLINIGHFGDQIKNYIDNNLFSFPIDYVNEGEHLLGTAGALRLAFDQNKLDKQFLVLYGDSFLPINFDEVYKDFNYSSNSALMTIYYNRNIYDKSNVVKNSNNTIFYDKTNNKNATYIDYGLSILSSDIVETYVLTNSYYKLADLFNRLSKDDKLIGYEVFDRFFEIGSFDGLKDFKEWVDVNGKFINNS